MKNLIRIYLLATCISICFTSCDRPSCENTHPILSQYEPEDPRYQKALIKLMEGKEWRFWLKAYENTGKHEYLWLNVQNDDICGLAAMRVEGKKGIEGILKAKGISYRGAELLGVKYEVFENREMLFKGLEHILD